LRFEKNVSDSRNEWGEKMKTIGILLIILFFTIVFLFTRQALGTKRALVLFGETGFMFAILLAAAWCFGQ